MARQNRYNRLLVAVSVMVWAVAWGSAAFAVPLQGGTLDPLLIPKYVIPLVIPPVMHDNGVANRYGIAVRQFKQQILPGGIWNTINGRTDNLAATTIWSYGPATDNAPDSTGLGGGIGIAPAANSQFNYPAYTIETLSGTPVNVRWINGLVDNTGAFLPHLLPVDQTVHWANPPATGCVMGVANRTDCATANPAPYAGPVPIITHVHGAHVDPHSDGYPEAWYLPAANNIPAGYSRKGTFFDDATGTNPGTGGYAEFHYRNDNPATTLWYHDHALGMTRNNVYAGPAGFWLVRGGAFDNATVTGGLPATLPGPPPMPGQTVLQLNIPTDNVRRAVREIPIAIQDRSFNADGSLFYPNSRAFFDTYPGPYTGSTPTSTDIHPIWNPEAFFNTMVVNGVAWPQLEVAPAFYRLRLLNGCNSRMLNLSLCQVDPLTDNCAVPKVEYPFYQIGAEQGFLRQVVMVETGFATPLPGNGTLPPTVTRVAAKGGPDQALLMGLAERADVIVDFTGLNNGTKIRMINTGADAPFGGFPALPVSDNATTGQVMQFVVNNALLKPADGNTTPPEALLMNFEPALPAATAKRRVSLNELESRQVCVTVDLQGNITVVYVSPTLLTPAQITATCAGYGALPMAPQEANVGVVDLSNPALPAGIHLAWEDESGVSNPMQVTMADNVTRKTVFVTENPRIVGGVAPVEEWDIYNFTVDAHPIHLHLVEFEVVNRTAMPAMPLVSGGGVQPWENGYKDTVIAYPGEITTVKARFDIPGLYVWHCHIVEHEDNEMMRPYVVSLGSRKYGQIDFDGDGKTDVAVRRPTTNMWYVKRSSDSAVVATQWGDPTDVAVAGDYDGDGKTDIAVWRPSTSMWYVKRSVDGGVTAAQWGDNTDVVVPGDYDGDGKADVAVWRPATSTWYVKRSSDNVVTAAAWGDPTDTPVPGDYDGDGKTDMAVWRSSTATWYVKHSLDGGVTVRQWGDNTDIPVSADYDGDGTTDIAVWRPLGGTWYVIRSFDGAVTATQWGGSGDVPVAGDFDGDGKADTAVWRPSDTRWYVKQSSNGAVTATQWGDGTDTALKRRY